MRRRNTIGALLLALCVALAGMAAGGGILWNAQADEPPAKTSSPIFYQTDFESVPAGYSGDMFLPTGGVLGIGNGAIVTSDSQSAHFDEHAIDGNTLKLTTSGNNAAFMWSWGAQQLEMPAGDYTLSLDVATSEPDDFLRVVWFDEDDSQYKLTECKTGHYEIDAVAGSGVEKYPRIEFYSSDLMTERSYYVDNVTVSKKSDLPAYAEMMTADFEGGKIPSDLAVNAESTVSVTGAEEYVINGAYSLYMQRTAASGWNNYFTFHKAFEANTYYTVKFKYRPVVLPNNKYAGNLASEGYFVFAINDGNNDNTSLVRFSDNPDYAQNAYNIQTRIVDDGVYELSAVIKTSTAPNGTGYLGYGNAGGVNATLVIDDFTLVKGIDDRTFTESAFSPKILGLDYDADSIELDVAVGEQLDFENFKVYKHISSGARVQLNADDYTVSDYQTTLGARTVDVTYTDEATGETFTLSLHATFGKESLGITLDTAAIETRYLLGETLDIDGLVVKHTFTVGDPVTLEKADYTVDTSKFDNTAAGTYTLTVTYGDDTADFDVTVSAVASSKVFYQTDFESVPAGTKGGLYLLTGGMLDDNSNNANATIVTDGCDSNETYYDEHAIDGNTLKMTTSSANVELMWGADLHGLPQGGYTLSFDLAVSSDDFLRVVWSEPYQLKPCTAGKVTMDVSVGDSVPRIKMYSGDLTTERSYYIDNVTLTYKGLRQPYQTVISTDFESGELIPELESALSSAYHPLDLAVTGEEKYVINGAYSLYMSTPWYDKGDDPNNDWGAFFTVKKAFKPNTYYTVKFKYRPITLSGNGQKYSNSLASPSFFVFEVTAADGPKSCQVRFTDNPDYGQNAYNTQTRIESDGIYELTAVLRTQDSTYASAYFGFNGGGELVIDDFSIVEGIDREVFSANTFAPKAVGLDYDKDTVTLTQKAGESIDFSGMKVYRTYSDGNRVALDPDAYTLPTDYDKTAGTRKVTVTHAYEDVTYTLELTLNFTRELTGISVDATNVKTTYKVGETLDLSGLVVTAAYHDGYTQAIEEDVLFGYTVDKSAFVSAQAGTYTLTVTFGEQTATFDVTVEEKDTPAPVAPESGCGCSGSVGTTSILGLLLLCGASAVMLKRRGVCKK